MVESPSYVKTGVGVAIGIGLLLSSILFFGGDRSVFKKFAYFKIKFDSTQGLDQGSVVSLAGIKAGNIEKIDFDSENHLNVLIKLEEPYAKLITENSLASIRTQGALGDKYVYIDLGPPTDKILAINEYIKVDREPDLMDLLSGKSSDIQNVKQVVEELNVLLKNLNADGRSAHLLTSIIDASNSFKFFMSNSDLKESFLHLKNVLAKVDNGTGTMGQLINDSTIHERLIRIMGDEPRNNYLKPLLREAIKQSEKNKH